MVPCRGHARIAVQLLPVFAEKNCYEQYRSTNVPVAVASCTVVEALRLVEAVGYSEVAWSPLTQLQ